MRAFILLAVLAFAYGERIKGTFESPDYAAFKAKFGKNYSAEEHDAHMAAYLKKVEFINNHNAEYDQGKHTFWCGVNEWSDLTEEEEAARNSIRGQDPYTGPRKQASGIAVPDSVNWVDQGKVGPIRNQGQCGSCWAFSVVCALEGAAAIANGAGVVDGSEQHLVSCDPYTSGCNGGWPYLSYDYICSDRPSKGIDTEQSYPYTAQTGTCNNAIVDDDQNIAATCSGKNILAADESALEEAVAIGPVSICLTVSSAWSSYSGGIFDDPSCGQSVNHAVTAVGYDKSAGYWLVRNSWGGSWGEAGYIKMVKNKNMCNMLSHCVYPTGAR